jgi:TRAP-type mannitol/chloroaromatic compound transport system substrate-binding protein
MTKLGVTVQVLPGGEIFQNLQTGAIDAAEWVGPYDDLNLQFQDVAQFYYYPGWWEPGPSLEVQIPLEVWNGLPEVYQEVIRTAAAQANVDMMAAYDAKNPPAIEQILESDVVLQPFPEEVMQAAEEAAFELFDEFSAQDQDFASVFESWKPFRDSAHSWFNVAESGMLNYQSQI